MAREKPKPTKMTIRSCFEDSISDIEGLRKEMEEWRDNMKEYFSETERYERVSEAAKALEEGFNALDSWESLVDEIEKYDEELLQTEITVYQFKFTRRGLARWRRLSNCMVAIESAKDWLEKLIDEEDREIPDEVRMEIEKLIGLYDEAKAYLEDVDFPTMFS